MRLNGPHAPHLTYCSNIHPGETWAEVRENLERYVVAVRREIAPERAFGLGLRLSGVAARELARPAELERFRALLDRNRLYLFTINGFPYGPFHGQRVKEEVYLPDWTDEERLAYTDLLATLLAELLPEEPGMEGTISTVPGAFAPRIRSGDDVRRMARQLGRHAAHLHRIRERSGKRLLLTLEPEPCCYLETVAQTVAFFREHLFGADAVDAVRQETGLPKEACERLLREHLGVCFDSCHMAVEYEEPDAALRAFAEAGIRVAKLQISAGLRVELSGDTSRDAAVLRELRSFADPVYLHQVVERGPHGIRRYLDLPDALRAAEDDPAPREWRIHFHVPLFREQLGAFRSTQPYVAEVIRLLRNEPCAPHWEVETYTWDVLPDEHRQESVVSAVTREMRWVLAQIG
ncbi:MAG TPA: metabolite traffic protein EboE [Longimicrobiaceae bacterium]|nr:metabolite traffic protein EboE [Longimicrobiaceae bacterium]